MNENFKDFIIYYLILFRSLEFKLLPSLATSYLYYILGSRIETNYTLNNPVKSFSKQIIR